MNKTIIILAAVALFVCAVVGGGYAYVNGLRHTGIDQYEKPASAQYQACQLTYSAYTAGFQEQFGVYTANLKGIDSYMSDAVKGRYDVKDAQGNPTGMVDANLFIKAIAEAYPDVQGINDLAGKLMDYVQSQREGFKNCQEKLVDMLNHYDSWRTNDIINSVVIRALGFPTENLVARLGDQKLTGTQAEDKMYQLVLTSGALQAYQSGVDNPLLTPSAP